MEREEEDERREAALASAAPLQPSFKPHSAVSHQQLSKFQELHRRRLLIKSKSMKSDNSQVKKGKQPRKNSSDTKDVMAAKASKIPVDEESADVCLGNKLDAKDYLQSDDGSSHHVSKKQRQKLHWGLDTKNRWEMKANM